jgi:hypothetical protein
LSNGAGSSYIKLLVYCSITVIVQPITSLGCWCDLSDTAPKAPTAACLSPGLTDPYACCPSWAAITGLTERLEWVSGRLIHCPITVIIDTVADLCAWGSRRGVALGPLTIDCAHLGTGALTGSYPYGAGGSRVKPFVYLPIAIIINAVADFGARGPRGSVALCCQLIGAAHLSTGVLTGSYPHGAGGSHVKPFVHHPIAVIIHAVAAFLGVFRTNPGHEGLILTTKRHSLVGILSRKRWAETGGSRHVGVMEGIYGDAQASASAAQVGRVEERCGARGYRVQPRHEGGNGAWESALKGSRGYGKVGRQSIPRHIGVLVSIHINAQGYVVGTATQTGKVEEIVGTKACGVWV